MRVGTRYRTTRSFDAAIVLLLALVTLAPASYYGQQAYRRIQGGFGATFEPERIRSRTLAPPGRMETLRNWLSAAFTRVPRVFIDIKFEHFETLRRKRAEAFEDGFLFRSEGDFVPATMRYGGQRIKAKVRLKGDFLDHLKTEKWSLRVETKGNAELFGMRRFSLQAPHTRFYQFEPLFLDHVRKEGIVAVRHRFVDVTLNGDHLGLMDLEEHFSKELLLSQGKPEGVIVGFDETDFWYGYQRSQRVEALLDSEGDDPEIPKVFDNWRLGQVEPFRPQRVAEVPLLARHAELAQGLLRGLQFGTLEPPEVFDVDLLTRWVALCDLWGTWHALRFHNSRLYLNPVTLKLEPVGFDGAIGKNWQPGLFTYRTSDLYAYVISDPQVAEAYKAHMQRLLRSPYLKELGRFLEEREAQYLRELHREFPDIGRFEFETIRRKSSLREQLQTPGPFTLLPYPERELFDVEEPPHSAAVYAYLVEREPGGAPYLELLNPLGSPVVVDELFLESAAGRVALSAVSDFRLPLTLEPSFHSALPWEATPPPPSIWLPLPKGLDRDSARIGGAAHIEGQRHVYEFAARPYVAPLAGPPFPERAAVAELLAQHPFLEWDGAAFRTKPGRFEVLRPLRIPPLVVGPAPALAAIRHAGLTVVAGTTLAFGRDAYLWLAGPLHLAGSPAAPAVLQGRDEASWRGLLVCGSPERSVWTHARIRDTDSTVDGPLQLTGGVTFYQSDVTMTDCDFERSLAEDALNVIRSHFELLRVGVRGTASDAIDGDFSTGTVAASRFEDIGGDAVDASASEVQIDDTVFSRVRDKALSFGEASTLRASALEIHGAGAAVASRDGSVATLERVRLREIEHVALMAYNKQPEYGAASLAATALDYDGSATLQAAQRGHVLTIDGKRMHTQRIDVEALYESGFMRK